MSTAERLINEGMGIGLEKGIRALLTLGMDIDSIASALGVPPAQVNAIIDSFSQK